MIASRADLEYYNVAGTPQFGMCIKPQNMEDGFGFFIGAESREQAANDINVVGPWLSPERQEQLRPYMIKHGFTPTF